MDRQRTRRRGTAEAPAWAAFVLAVALAALARPAGAQVPCRSTEDLCTGDPCMIPKVKLTETCELDFGSRTVVITGPVRIPDGGLLFLKAGTVVVDAPIIGRVAGGAADVGVRVSLEASNLIRVSRRIDVSARTTPGQILLRAAGDVVLGAPLRARTRGRNSTAAGGLVVVLAGGEIRSRRRALIQASGGPASEGGVIVLGGMRGVDLGGRVDARGSSGGSAIVGSPEGDVVMTRKVQVDGRSDRGGVISIGAGGGVRTRKKMLAIGRLAGGTIEVSGTNAVIEGPLGVRSRSGPGGLVSIDVEQGVRVLEEVIASGATGGQIEIIGRSGDVDLDGPLDATGKRATGGRIDVAAAGDIVVTRPIAADGRNAGGDIVLTAGNRMTLIEGSAIFAEGDVGGGIDILGAVTTVNAGASVQVDGDTEGGRLRLEATSGNLVLNGSFRARGDQGGIIEGEATNDLRASGNFQASATGCMGLSAGRGLDLSGAQFDVPVLMMCP